MTWTGVTRRRFGTVALGGALVATSASSIASDAYAGNVGPVALPQPPRDGLPRRLPEAQGVSSASILGFLDDIAAAGLELHSFMLSRGGAVVAEGWWWPYEPQRVHMTHSLTKSVMVNGVALALAERRFALDDRIVAFFPEHVPHNAGNNLKAMTVRDLLTMQTGHDHETSGSEWRPLKTSWISAFMKIPVPYQPGTRWVYTSAASYMLSALVTKTTGQKLTDYLRPRLLEPLGITNYQWDVSPEGVTTGGNGLSWTCADSLKLGMLYAKNGLWRGRQLLPPGWIASARQKQASDGPYGYQWWLGEAVLITHLASSGSLRSSFPTTTPWSQSSQRWTPPNSCCRTFGNIFRPPLRRSLSQSTPTLCRTARARCGSFLPCLARWGKFRPPCPTGSLRSRPMIRARAWWHSSSQGKRFATAWWTSGAAIPSLPGLTTGWSRIPL